MSLLGSHFSFLFEGSAYDINWIPRQPTLLSMTLQTGVVFVSNNMAAREGMGRGKNLNN